MYEDEYGIPLKLNHELKTMKEAEDYFNNPFGETSNDSIYNEQDSITGVEIDPYFK